MADNRCPGRPKILLDKRRRLPADLLYSQQQPQRSRTRMESYLPNWGTEARFRLTSVCPSLRVIASLSLTKANQREFVNTELGLTIGGR
jgi:hypothetical protein